MLRYRTLRGPVYDAYPLVVRVAGSWIAAIGLLVLGWTVRGAG